MTGSSFAPQLRMAEAKPGRADQPDPNEAFVTELALARQAETRTRELGRGIRTLVQWGQTQQWCHQPPNRRSKADARK
jgi:hypothetical protein